MPPLLAVLAAVPSLSAAFHLPPCAMARGAAAYHRTSAPTPSMGFFDDMFKKNEAAEAQKEEQMRAQQEILNRRRNPAASRAYASELAARRQAANKKAQDSIAWQRTENVDPIIEFKKRKAAGNLNKMGYEDEPKGGLPLPMASFGVGGEFGLGGKYDNGERFDLRLPYAERGWTEENDTEQVESVDFFANLLSGGRLQREADKRRREEGGKN